MHATLAPPTSRLKRHSCQELSQGKPAMYARNAQKMYFYWNDLIVAWQESIFLKTCTIGCTSYHGARCSYDFIGHCISGNRLASFIPLKFSFPPCPWQPKFWNYNGGGGPTNTFLGTFVLVSKKCEKSTFVQKTVETVLTFFSGQRWGQVLSDINYETKFGILSSWCIF